MVVRTLRKKRSAGPVRIRARKYRSAGPVRSPIEIPLIFLVKDFSRTRLLKTYSRLREGKNPPVVVSGAQLDGIWVLV